MNLDEWEKICNNCGWCCLIKIQNDDTDEVFYTRAICKYFDPQTSKCSEYENRCKLVPECLKLTPENVDKIEWMPKCCRYRTLFQAMPPSTEPKAATFCISENEVPEEDLEDYIIYE